MDVQDEIRDFLSSRRAQITPQQAGLPVFGDTRRVPGLRREEAAMFAGVSVHYYTKIERGHLRGVSESVLDALARGLQLDQAERDHLFDLARAAGPMPRARRRPAAQRVRPSVQRIIDAMTHAPAVIKNGRLDILTANQLGYALFTELDVAPGRPANLVRYVFLDARATSFTPTGTRPPTTRSRCCARRPAATRTRPTRTSPCSHTPPSPAQDRRKRSASSAAGPPRPQPNSSHRRGDPAAPQPASRRKPTG